MKILSFIFLILLFTTSFLYAQQKEDSYNEQWLRVYKFELDELPKSASEIVDSIYIQAKKEHNNPQLVKALIFQSKFMLSLQEDAQLNIIQLFKQEITQNSFPVSNILESILAHNYWQYYTQNRWQIYNRTRTTEKVDSLDFRTWDLGTLFTEIHHHFQSSLQQEVRLQKLDIHEFKEILILKEDSKKFRPSLYDFLAHKALDFYKSNESGISKPSFKFEIDNPQFFGDFSVQELQTKDSLSSHYQALKIYQKLLLFHANDQEPDAKLDVKLEQLGFVRRNSTLPDKETHYLNALKELRTKHKDHPLSAYVTFLIASFYNNQANKYRPGVHEEYRFNKREALQLCKEAINKFPESEGAESCNILKNKIYQPSLRVTAEKYIPPNLPSRLLLEYKNMDSLNCKVYKVSKDENERINKLRNDSTRQAFIDALDLEKEWSSSLRNERDFQQHTTEILVPGLPKGSFLLLVSPSGKALKEGDTFGYRFLQVTNLALVQKHTDKGHSFQVLDRNNGKPIEGASVHLENIGRERNNNRFDKKFETDSYGTFSVPTNSHFNNLEARVSYRDDEAHFGDYYIYNYRNRDINSIEEVIIKPFLFTDRSIYRPGQQVHFKGILLKKQGYQSEVVAGEYVEVVLEDANGQELSNQRLLTNEFGSFSGQFLLPEKGLTGEYMILVEEDIEEDSKLFDEIMYEFDWLEHSISVEEYKRPKFEVEFEAVKESYRLNDTIEVKGSAMAFSGSNITDAKVIYAVQRKVQYPSWYYRYNSYPYQGAEAMEITHGETTTNAKGAFSIEFKAIPDNKALKEDLPVFHYEIKANITDINGETRSASTIVKVGYHTLMASIEAPDKIDLDNEDYSISLRTQNLNGESLTAQGSLKIYKLQAPDHVLRKRPWSAPDYQEFSKNEFSALFPHDPFENEDDPKNWQKGKLLWETSFDTEQSKNIDLNLEKHWPHGTYIIELESQDAFGQQVVDSHHFNLFSTKNKKLPPNTLFSIEADKAAYKPGEMVKLTLGSASTDLVVTLNFESKNPQLSKARIITVNNAIRELEIPVSQEDMDGFAIHYSYAAYNSFESGHINIRVLNSQEELAIETLSFRDKLLPGENQKWSFQIKGNKREKVVAEVLAAMYDASLDQFKTHRWNFTPHKERPFYARNQNIGQHSFGNKMFTIRNIPTIRHHSSQQGYDQLDWFGFSFTGNLSRQRQYLSRIAYVLSTPSFPSKISSSLKSKNDQSLLKGFVFGRVNSSEGEILPGVSVLIKGKKNGAVTDLEGNYSIKAVTGDTLIFSFVGYNTLSTSIGKENVIDVTLAPDIQRLEEVIVLGYGTQQKREVTGAVSTIEVEDSFEEISLDMDLEGRAAGVEVSWHPENSEGIKLRGISSLNGNNNYLYVIDGLVVEEFDLNREEILGMEILKGDAATALYGAGASKGVVIISTKEGQKKLDATLAQVRTRQNLQETAFFFPHLSTDKKGVVSFTFTAPEALTRWKFQLLAHTKKASTTTKNLQVVTQQKLMVIPNPPRFLREGDTIVFQAKISNLSTETQSGFAAIQLFDALSGKAVDEIFGNDIHLRNQPFTINANGNTQVSWKLNIPKGIQAVQYKVVAKAGDYADGEQNILPVLPNRMLVSETLPIWVRARQSKTFSLEKLKNQRSASLQHHALTLEMTSNPAWYALQSLPYLMEYPYECAEQTFARYYANALAGDMINAHPKLKSVIDHWATTASMESNLEKNTELKSLIIQETPWLRNAQSESEQKKRLALLFDLNKMERERSITIAKLGEIQMASGGFPWFKGSRYPNRFITQHIATGFGHLAHLGLESDKDAAPILGKTLQYLDKEILADYHRLLEQAHLEKEKEPNKEKGLLREKEYLANNYPRPLQIQYLYMSSFYPDREVLQEASLAIDYYTQQSLKYWKEQTLYIKAMIALIQYRNGHEASAQAIIQSLKENSITSEEMGMYWKQNNASWLWHQAPIETQALLIEAFTEIGDPRLSIEDQQQLIDEMKVWLLKHKQTNQWTTTKATTTAVYALLMKGSDWISVTDLLEISVGDQIIDPSTIKDVNVEVGSGYFKTAWKDNEITREMSEVKVEAKGNEMAWGGLYWQYFEDLDKISSAATPLKLNKKLFLKTNTASGEEMIAINANRSLKVGDLLRVRIELKVDREMDFVHMKDMRASGLEPVNVLSQYKWQDGLGYYESTRDASTNFFFEHLSKGVYVFEYDLRVNNQGDFSNGITSIQSMYAPEFSSHSEGIRVLVTE